MYTIVVTYTTGDSYHNHNQTNNIGLCWENKTLAQKALQTIKQHYLFYRDFQELRWSRSNTHQQIFKQVRKCEWFKKAVEDPTVIGIRKNERDWYYFCVAEMDDGTYRNIPTSMWCGHFETLHTAKISLLEEDENDYIDFDSYTR